MVEFAPLATHSQQIPATDEFKMGNLPGTAHVLYKAQQRKGKGVNVGGKENDTGIIDSNHGRGQSDVWSSIPTVY